MDSDAFWTVKEAVKCLYFANKKLSDTPQKSKANLRRRIKYAIEHGKLLLNGNQLLDRSACLKWADKCGLNIPPELRHLMPITGHAHLKLPAWTLTATGVVVDELGGFPPPKTLEHALARIEELENENMRIRVELRVEQSKKSGLEAKNAELQTRNAGLQAELNAIEEQKSQVGRQRVEYRYAAIRERETQLRQKGLPLQKAHQQAVIESRTGVLKQKN